LCFIKKQVTKYKKTFNQTYSEKIKMSNTTNYNEYERIRRTTEDIIEGRKRIVRLDEQGEKGRILAGKTTVESSCILGECKRTNPSLFRDAKQKYGDGLIEEQLLADYAK